MSLLRAIETGDVTELPGRRDEDWRWSDLRGLVRTLPQPSAAYGGAIGPGRFDGLTSDTYQLVNGGDLDLELAPGEARTVSLARLSRGEGRHASRVSIQLGAGAQLTLLETLDSDGASLAHHDLVLTLDQGRNWPNRRQNSSRKAPSVAAMKAHAPNSQAAAASPK